MATEVDAPTAPEPGPSRRTRREATLPAWQRLLRFLPAVVFIAMFGFFFVTKFDQAKTVSKSGRGLLTLAAIVVGYVVISFVLKRFVRWAWVAPVVLTAIVVGLWMWVARPYYVEETVNREIVTGPVADAPPDSAADEAADTEAPPAGETPAQAVRLGSGTIVGIDHDAGGTVSLIENPDGSQVLRFENWEVEGAPDRILYIVEGNDVQDPGGTELGGFDGTNGSVTDYALPEGTQAGPGWTVLVWCRSFAVPIANSTLA